MIQIIHYGICPKCSKTCFQVSWQGTDPHEIPEFAKFAIPNLYCCSLPFKAIRIQMLNNGSLISEQLL
ncbi:MAG: hypothetical protein DMG06_20295 [Acidobacteria bacterium]|nr:MAG: hypothetical protein DMG06_20295 [Acidobacteriota bacterium]